MATTKKPYAPPAALRWNQLACEALYYTKTPPTIAARALAIIHTAMYDAWSIFSEGKEQSTTTGDLYQKPCDLDWNTSQNRLQAYSFAAYRAILHDAIFANPLPDAFKDKLKVYMAEDLSFDPNDTNQDPDNPAGIGNLSAKLVLDLRAGDCSNQANGYKDWTGYVPVNPPPPEKVNQIDHWQPQLGPNRGAAQKFLTPHWGRVTPFALCSGAQFRPPKPIDKDHKDFKALGDYITDISAGLTEEHKIIAEYWAGMHEDKFPGMVNDPASGVWASPPAQLCRIANEICVKRQYAAGMVVPLYFVLTNALLDASIAAWDAKRTYDYVRPDSMIVELRDGECFEAWGGPCRDTVEIEGEGWCPYLLTTPPFPEYVSGHSTFSATFADVIKCFTGDGSYGGSLTVPAKGTRIEPNCTPEAPVSLTWATVDDAAAQASVSRLYGGIHFVPGCTEGLVLGKKVAETVYAKACRYLNGTL